MQEKKHRPFNMIRSMMWCCEEWATGNVLGTNDYYHCLDRMKDFRRNYLKLKMCLSFLIAYWGIFFFLNNKLDNNKLSNKYTVE